MRVLRWALIGAAAVLVSCGGGSSSTSTEAGEKASYKVGDTGPSGGVIFYVSEAGFGNSDTEKTSLGSLCPTESCRYLEMAATDLPGQHPWEEAMAVAEAFSTPSASDWVLPSRDALNEMCKYALGDTVNDVCNNDGNGSLSLKDKGFSPSNYWSSSHYFEDVAWTQDFLDGVQDGSRKVPEEAYYVRPVRAF